MYCVWTCLLLGCISWARCVVCIGQACQSSPANENEMKWKYWLLSADHFWLRKELRVSQCLSVRHKFVKGTEPSSFSLRSISGLSQVFLRCVSGHFKLFFFLSDQINSLSYFIETEPKILCLVLTPLALTLTPPPLGTWPLLFLLLRGPWSSPEYLVAIAVTSRADFSFFQPFEQNEIH